MGYNEVRHKARMKKLKRRLRRFDPLALIDQILKYLYHDYSEGIEQLKKQPWLQLLLIKWVLEDDQFGKKGRPAPSQHDATQLMNGMLRLQRSLRMPTEYDDYRLWMRAISFQQFTFQTQFTLNYLGRQKLLFADLEANHLFTRQFQQQIGMPIFTFLALSFALVTRFYDSKAYRVTESWFGREISAHFGEENVSSLLRVLSLDLSELRRRLRSREPMPPAMEYYEQSPLIEYPLLQQPNGFLNLYPMLLFRCLEHFVYDRLKAPDPAAFMDRFGRIFERYVAIGLRNSTLVMKDEDELRRDLPRGECVDFLVHDQRLNVYVDAKGVEMSDNAKATHRFDVLRGRIKRSVLKAISQANAVRSQVDRIAPKDGVNFSVADEHFVIVVTYKEMYLGNGRTLLGTYAVQDWDRLRLQYADTLIPAENIYFLTINEFDTLLGQIERGEQTLRDALVSVRLADSRAETQKMFFTQHLLELGNFDPPTFLDEATNVVIDSVEAAFTE